MTEDDTFRILARPSFSELMVQHNRWIRDFYDDRAWPEVLKDNNWTIKEYTKYVND